MTQSGSTLQYLLSKEIVAKHGGKTLGNLGGQSLDKLIQLFDGSYPYLLIKTHAFPAAANRLFDESRAGAIFVHRDLRDSIVSNRRKHTHLNFDRLTVIEQITRTKLAQQAGWQAIDHKLVSRYDIMSADIKTEALRISQFLQLDITDEFATELAEKYALKAQKKRIAGFDFEKHGIKKRHTYFDPVTQLHSNHIGTGLSGQYKTELRPIQIALIEALAEEWLIKHQYPLSQSWELRQFSKAWLAWHKLRYR